MEVKHDHPPLSDEEKEKLLSQIMSSNSYKPNAKGTFLKWRDFTACYMSFYCGLRPMEFLYLTWEDINFETSEIRVKSYTNKQRCDKPATMPETVKNVLLDYYAIIEELGSKFKLLFPSIETFEPLSSDRFLRIIQKHARECGIIKILWFSESGQPHYNVTGYAGRRYFANAVYRKTYSEYAVKELMRHKNIQSAEPYIRMDHVDKKKLINHVFKPNL